jgi:uncharacterized protein (DUF302 family)
MAAQGLTKIRSSHGPQDTMNRLGAVVQAKGMTVFARIDHAAGAAGAGLSLRPTELLIFGNAQAGTPLMQAVQTIGIDLPLKALVWQDASGHTWLSYNIPSGWRSGTGSPPGHRPRSASRRLPSMRWRKPRQEGDQSTSGGSRRQKTRRHFICPSNFAAPLPGLDKRLSASRPPAA